MTTQTAQGGKGKKRNKESNKISLDEFNQIDAPHGHSVVSLKMTGLDWAETMADYEHQSTETQQIIVPAAPRAQRGPAINIDSLPNEPPFRVSLFGLPMSLEEKEISDRFFYGIDVRRVEISKSSTTVELGSKNDLYEALCKDGVSIKGRTISVCLYGQQPSNSYGADRYGGRGGGNSSYGDRYNDRNQGGGGFGASRTGDRYGDRPAGGGFGRDRNNFANDRATGGGYGSGRSGGYTQSRGRYGDKFADTGSFRDNPRGGSYTSRSGEPSSDEPSDWRARPNIVARPSPPPSAPSQSFTGGVSRQPYPPARHEQSHHQQQHHYQAPPSHHNQYHNNDSYNNRFQSHHNQPHNQQHNQPSNHSPYQDYPNPNNNRPVTSAASSTEERPKLVLQKRKVPINVDDVSSVARNEAIFGAAKPSSTPYLKMQEIEDKLKSVQLTPKKDAKATSQSSDNTSSAPNEPQQQPTPPRTKGLSESSQQDDARTIQS